MTNIRADIEGLLPLPVSECIVNDPFITLLGQGWSANINTRWRLIFPGEVIDSDVDIARVPEALQMLTDRVLTACEIDDGLFDPCFVFDGPRLEVLADTEYDPWVMHLTGLPFVLVGRGPLSHRDWLAERAEPQPPVV